METEAARKTVREAVAVFTEAASLDEALAELRAAGFANGDLSLLAGREAAERRLGHPVERIEDLEDEPAAPRTGVVSRERLDEREARVVGGFTILPTVLAAGTIVASGGAAVAAILGTALAGALAGNVFAGFMERRHADWLQEQLDHGGILLWVRTPDEESERQAVTILGRHATHDIHIHEIPVPG